MANDKNNAKLVGDNAKAALGESLEALLIFHAGVGSILEMVLGWKEAEEAGGAAVTLDQLKNAVATIAQGHILTTNALTATVEDFAARMPKPEGVLYN